MSDKKHIDRLFQETFKDFEQVPNDAVWERIESKLKEKKKHRVIPIWWRYAGVAALLLLLLTIGKVYFNDEDSINPSNQVVDTEKPSKLNTEEQDNTKDNSVNKTIENDDAIANSNTSENDKQTNENENGSEKNHTVLNPSNKSSVANVPSKNETKSSLNNASVSNEKSNKKDNLIQSKTVNKTEIVIADNSKETSGKTPKIDNAEFDKAKANNEINKIKNSNEAIADAKTEDAKTTTGTEKNSITIEEAIEKNKDINEEEKDLSRWSVAPNAAPVFFNTLGKGSSIDPQFNNNSKSGDVNMSYGINASYAINKKLSVRSGINKVNLGYNTNDVVVFQTLGLSSSIKVLKNVKPEINNTAGDISVLSAQSFANKSSESFIAGTTTNTSINQSLSYIEIPLEIQYMLSDKRLGVNVIGGFSSFFLNDNELFSNFEGSKTSIGEASNVNTISYSANFGFGLNYKVTKKINLNLEPMFKYQINTFNNTSGDFKPFFIGVYTGFGIKF